MSKLDAILSAALPSILQSVGLPPIPIDGEMLRELKGAFAKDKGGGGASVSDSWSMVATLGVVSRLPDDKFRLLVSSILADSRFEELNRQLVTAIALKAREAGLE